MCAAALMMMGALPVTLQTPARGEPAPGPMFLPSDARVATMGRLDWRDPARPRLGFPGVTIRVRFTGASLSLRTAETGGSSYDVTVDGEDPRTVRTEVGERDYALAEYLTGGPHAADIVRRTETWQGITTLLGLRLAPGGELLPPGPWPTRKLLFIGDSVTAGEGTDRDGPCVKDAPRFSNARLSYGMLLARTLDAQAHLVAFGGRGLVRDWQGRKDVLNAPQFFPLALPEEGGPPFDLGSYVPDAVVISLGTNDFNLALGPPPERELYVSAYVRLVRDLRGHYPGAHVFLTPGAMVRDVAPPASSAAADATSAGATANPPALPAGGPRSQLQSYITDTIALLADPRVHDAGGEVYPGDACDAHPTKAQHRGIARDLEPVLRRALGW